MSLPVAGSCPPDCPSRVAPWYASRILLLLPIVFGLGVYGYRLTLGTNLGDEAYYANLVVEQMRSPAGDTGDNSAHLMFALLTQPVVRLYSYIFPNFDGIILFLRCVYAALALSTALITWSFLREVLPALVALVLALVPVAFIPFGLPAPSYNTIGMLGTISALCLYAGHLVRVWEGGRRADGSPVRTGRFGGLVAPFASVLFVLGVIAYPTTLGAAVAFILLAVILAPSWKDARPLLPLLAYGSLFLLLGLGLVVGGLGPNKLRAILSYDGDAATHLNWRQTVGVGWGQFTQQGNFPIYCLLGLIVTSLTRVFPGRGIRVLHTVILLVLVVSVLRLPSPCFFAPGHDLVFFLAVVGFPILFDLRRPAALSPRQRIFLILYCTGIIAGLLTTWTAFHALFNFSVGGLLAVIASLGYLALDPLPKRSGAGANIALPVGAVGGLAFCSFLMIYGHGLVRPSTLDTVVRSGPFAGLRTTKDQATFIAQARRMLAAWEDRCRTVLVINPYAGLYLLTTLEPRTPHSFFVTAEPALWKRLHAMAAEPTDLPDLIVDYPEPGTYYQGQVGFLETYYRMVDGPGRIQLYLRRDIPAPPLRCPYRFRFDCSPRGTGWSVPESSGDGQDGFIWMAAREATVRLPRPLAEGALRLRIEVGDAMAPDILDSLSLRVNDHPARLTTATGRPRTFEATLTTTHLDPSPAEVVLQFSVNRTIVPPGDGRTLAVMFRELELTEVEGPATISHSKVPGSSDSD